MNKTTEQFLNEMQDLANEIRLYQKQVFKTAQLTGKSRPSFRDERATWQLAEHMHAVLELQLLHDNGAANKPYSDKAESTLSDSSDWLSRDIKSDPEVSLEVRGFAEKVFNLCTQQTTMHA